MHVNFGLGLIGLLDKWKHTPIVLHTCSLLTFPVPLPVDEAVVTVGGPVPGVTAEKEEVVEEVEEGG